MNTSKTIWPYNLSPLITRDKAFPGFSYDVSICLVMVFRSCPVVANLVFKLKASFKLQLAPLAVSTYLSCFLVLSGLHPKSFPTRLASQGSFSCQVCQQISSHQFRLNKLLGSSGPPPGTERKRGIAAGRNLPGWGPRPAAPRSAPQRPAAPRAGKLGNLMVSSVPANRHLGSPRGHWGNLRSPESRGLLAPAERSLQT